MKYPSLVALTVTALLAGTVQLATAQQPQRQQRDCTVRKDPNGMIRGDRIPRGCVLVQESVSRHATRPTPAIDCREALLRTPNVKKATLENCVRLSRGRLIIPTTPPSEQSALRRHFGPIQRHFGPLNRHFGPLNRNFGPLKRHFGPLERNFGSSSSPSRKSDGT